MGEAVGMLEVFGLATAYAAADAGCKAGNVRLETFDKNKPANADELPVPLIVMVKFRGSVSDVQAALEAASARAKELAGIVTEYKIARPTEDTEKMLKLSGLDKGTPNKKYLNEKIFPNNLLGRDCGRNVVRSRARTTGIALHDWYGDRRRLEP